MQNVLVKGCLRKFHAEQCGDFVEQISDGREAVLDIFFAYGS